MNIPIIFYINLDHRQDRLNHIINQLESINYPKNKIIRIPAIQTDFGGLGCARSHVKTIEKFLESGEDRCIVLEDDFTFYQNITADRFYKILDNLPENWDIVMLSSNTLSDSDFSDNFKKCNNAQTASGYMVSKKFASTLLQNFKESESNLTAGHNYEIYAVDQYWKKLQPHSDWFICNPKVGYQMESYSDISKFVVNHGV
jgi:GR25 family glycosyltransferase involved in LPS biosynthesis